MKLANERILKDLPVLSELTKKEFPVKVSYAIAKNLTKIEAELKAYNREREKLEEKYAVKDENGKIKIVNTNQIQIQQEYVEDWNKSITELMEIENEIDIHLFRFSDLDGCKITPGELMAIDYMIME